MFITEDLKKKGKEDLFISFDILHVYGVVPSEISGGTTHLSKIPSLIWSKVRQEMSESIFRKSTTFWF